MVVYCDYINACMSMNVVICRYAYEEKDVVVLKKQNKANPNFFRCGKVYLHGSYRGLDLFCFAIPFSHTLAYSYMGRGVVEAPVEEIAEFLSQPEAPLFYDHHIVVRRKLLSSGRAKHHKHTTECAWCLYVSLMIDCFSLNNIII